MVQLQGVALNFRKCKHNLKHVGLPQIPLVTAQARIVFLLRRQVHDMQRDMLASMNLDR